jgi:hypothetical protein
MPAVIPLVVAGVSAGATVYGAKKSSAAAKASAKYQTDTANYAADLEAKSSADALAFAREQEAQRHKEFAATQDRNYALWLSDQDREQQRYDTRRADLAPYRALGAGSIGQLAKPIYAPGTLGNLVGR